MPRDWVQWVASGVSVVVLVAVVGLLVSDGLAGQSGPPVPVVTLHHDRAYETSTGWLLPATLTNQGGEAAEALLVVATATVDGVEEESEVTVDYAPSGSDVELTFGFSAEPDGEIAVRVSGFRLP